MASDNINYKGSYVVYDKFYVAQSIIDKGCNNLKLSTSSTLIWINTKILRWVKANNPKVESQGSDNWSVHMI